MTKEEFIHIVDRELYKLNEEYKKVFEELAFLESLDNSRDNEEINKYEYKLSLLSQRREQLKKLLTYPAMSRIMHMSKEEIEEYKKAKISQINLEIEKLKNEETQHNLNKEKLESRLNFIKHEYIFLTGTNREKLLAEAKAIIEELSYYETEQEWGTFPKIKAKMDNLEGEIERIKNMPSIDIKKEICLIAQGEQVFKYLLSRASNKDVYSSRKLLAAVGDDQNKTFEMAKLIKEYTALATNKELFTEHQVDMEMGLPISYVDSIPSEDFIWTRRDFSINLNASNIDSFGNNLNDAYLKFISEKEKINQEYTYEKLKGIGLDLEIGDIVDSEFIKLHGDKINKEDTKRLKTYESELKILLNNSFRLMKRKEIAEARDTISDIKKNIYDQVEHWYCVNYKGVVGSNYQFPSYGNWKNRETRKSLEEDLKRLYSEMGSTEQAFNRLREKVAVIRTSIELEQSEKRKQMDLIEEKIKTLAGPEYSIYEIPIKPIIDENNLVPFVEQVNREYTDTLMSRIDDEAKNQSEDETSLITGKSKEELRQLRDQVKQAINYPEDYLTKDDILTM